MGRPKGQKKIHDSRYEAWLARMRAELKAMPPPKTREECTKETIARCQRMIREGLDG